MASSLVAIYHGSTVADLQLVAASADPRLVRQISSEILREYEQPQSNPVLAKIKAGRRAALRALVTKT